MKRSLDSGYILMAVAALFCAVAAAQTTVKKVPPKPTAALDGKTLYNEYCAVCHGPGGKGNGPAAKALKLPPADLTLISRNHGGRFPDQQILTSLKEGATSAHGSRDMPVWGPIFRDMNSGLGVAQTRMHSLLIYLEQLQTR